jgi:hypothetical protein
MKIFVLILSLTFIHVVACGQSDCNFVSKAEMVDFVRWKITSDNAAKKYYEIKQIDLKIIRWDSADYELIGSIDTIMTENDRTYMGSQLNCYVDKADRWKREDFPMVQVLNPKPTKRIKKQNDHYWAYSIPIFSADKSYCIIKYQFECGGGLCASYMTTLFKRTEHGWTEIKELSHVEA